MTRSILLGAVASGLMMLAPVLAQAASPEATRAAIQGELDKDYPALDALYLDLHRHPELAFQETRTAALLAQKMRALGFTVTEKVGGTGLVAIYRNGPGPVVLVRTELDGLPMEEKTGLPYASRDQQQSDGKTSFVTHSCGHDNHMAWWIGSAEALVALRGQWSGTLMFIAQPAEETGKGAEAMLKDGLFTRFPKPDYGFAAHVNSAPSGTVEVKDGAVTSNSDAINITFVGRGAHGSIPSASIDPIVMGAHFVNDVQTVISRQKEAASFGVITVGSFQAGTVGNIIPDQALLKLTIRSYTPQVRQGLLDGVTRTANAAALMAMAPPPVIQHLGSLTAVTNDHALTERTFQALNAAYGDRIHFAPATAPGWSASEDYSDYILAGVPSVFMMIGGYDQARLDAYKAKGESVPTNHSPFFAPDHERAIRTGVEALTTAVMTVTPLAR
ncbi:MAG: amidohydrolase [Caulobacteraceae bacterium]|nr:amidohydrolase [Caulobacteraceae bacterium]